MTVILKKYRIKIKKALAQLGVQPLLVIEYDADAIKSSLDALCIIELQD